MKPNSNQHTNILAGFICPVCQTFIPTNSDEIELRITSQSIETYEYCAETGSLVVNEVKEYIYDRHVVHRTCKTEDEIVYYGLLDDILVVLDLPNKEIIKVGRYWRDKFDNDEDFRKFVMIAITKYII